MGLFGRKGGKTKGRKVVVVGIDGVPFSFLQGQIQAGRMARFARLVEGGSLKRMNSVIPTVSSVAWSSYMTGKNPGKHNIYGFVDRHPNPYEVYIPNSSSMKGETLWEILSRHGKRVIVINVPVTYPPRPVNGLLVSGFLATRLEKAVYPQSLGQTLKDLDYRIDVDAWKAHEDTDAFLEDVNQTLESRIKTTFYLMEKEDWDFFQIHIMETDRINHFLWEHWESGDEGYASAFQTFYERIDGFLGEMEERLDGDTELIVLSDHGFCTLKKEVFLNRWLEDHGYLQLRPSEKRTFKDIENGSRAYSLIPGRLYVNLKGREEHGGVDSGDEYEEVRQQLMSELSRVKDPDTGERIVGAVHRREELYHGASFEQAADLVVVPEDGYDLKGNLDSDTLTHKGPIVGMHTFDDAALYIRGREIGAEHFSIVDVMPTLLTMMDVSVPADVDGTSVI